jgi:hypothetical protein
MTGSQKFSEIGCTENLLESGFLRPWNHVQNPIAAPEKGFRAWAPSIHSSPTPSAKHLHHWTPEERRTRFRSKGQMTRPTAPQTAFLGDRVNRLKPLLIHLSNK